MTERTHYADDATIAYIAELERKLEVANSRISEACPAERRKALAEAAKLVEQMDVTEPALHASNSANAILLFKQLVKLRLFDAAAETK